MSKDLPKFGQRIPSDPPTATEPEEKEEKKPVTVGHVAGSIIVITLALSIASLVVLGVIMLWKAALS